MSTRARRAPRLRRQAIQAAAAVRARPVLAAALVYALLALAMFSPALMPGKVLSNSDMSWFAAPWSAVKPPELVQGSNGDLTDTPRMFQVWHEYASNRIGSDIPLWNPYSMAGRPFVANGLSAVFSPFSIPVYVLPFWESLAVQAALLLFVGSFGVFMLARALGLGWGGALLAGVVFGFNPYVVAWVTVPGVGAWMLMPWLMLATERLLREPGLKWGAGFAALMGLQFLVGHPQLSFQVVAAVTVFFALRLIAAQRAGELGMGGWRRPALGFLAGGVGGGLLAAAVLLPFIELLAGSADLEERYDNQIHLPARALNGMLLPDWDGTPTKQTLAPFFIAQAWYPGALAWMLAAGAVLLKPARARIVTLVAGTVCVLVVVGAEPFFSVLHLLPGFAEANNSRLVIVVMLCVALLAGWGLDDLVAARPDRRLLAIAAAVLAVPLLYLFTEWPAVEEIPPAIDLALGGYPDALREEATRVDVIRWAALLGWFALAGAAFALLALRRRRGLAPAALVAGAVLVLALDLFRVGMGYNPAIDRDLAVQPVTGAMHALEQRHPERFAGIGQEALPENLGMRYGLHDARGYDFPIIKRYDHLWRRIDQRETANIGLPHYPRNVPFINADRERALNLLAVSHYYQPPQDEPLFGYVPVYEGFDGRVFWNPKALPRTFVVESQRVVDGEDEALDAVLDPAFDGRRVAVTEEPLDGLPGAVDGQPEPKGRSDIVTYEAERVVVQASTEAESLVVLADVHYPGWKARVNGEEEPVERVDYLLRGVRVGPGQHRVEFFYEPLSWRVGWIVSLLSLAGLVALAGVLWRRRSRESTPRSSPPSAR